MTQDNGENGEHVFTNLTDVLMAPIGIKGDVMVTRLEGLGLQWRRTAIDILKQTDPTGVTLYRSVKYADGATDNPDLDTRREAYKVAALRVIEQHFDHPLCEGWRQIAAKVVEALDPVVYAEYRQVKHGAGDPDLATKIEAYRIVIERFLALSYTVANL